MAMLELSSMAALANAKKLGIMTLVNSILGQQVMCRCTKLSSMCSNTMLALVYNKATVTMLT